MNEFTQLLDALDGLGSVSTGAEGASGGSASPSLAPEYIPPTPGSAPSVAKLVPGQTDAETAINRVAQLYRDLQNQSQRILSVYGRKIPCEVASRYESAVQAYLLTAKSVFDQITASGVQVKQQIYDQNGKLLHEVVGPNPVMPTTFNVVGCTPKLAPLAGALGAVPTMTIGNFGAFGLGWFAWIVIALIGSAGVVVAAKQIAVNWPSEAVRAAEAQKIWLETKLSCVETKIKSGMSAERAEASCEKDLGPAAPPPPGGPRSDFFRSLGIATILVAAGTVAGILLYRAMSPSVQAAKARRLAARDLEERLRQQAQRYRDEARRVRSSGAVPEYAPVAARLPVDDYARGEEAEMNGYDDWGCCSC